MAKQLKTIKFEEKEKRKGKTTTKRKEKKKTQTISRSLPLINHLKRPT